MSEEYPATRKEGSSRSAGRIAPILLLCFFIILILLTAYLQVPRLAEGRRLQEAVLTLLLLGVPLTSYHFHREIRRAGRPILAGLMHALALFSAIISLAIADMGDPIARALAPAEQQASEKSEAARPQSGPTPAATSHGTVATNGANISSTGKERGGKLAPVAPTPAPAPRPASASAPVPVPASTRAVDPSDVEPRSVHVVPRERSATYSLYDMLSLVGMIATITLIVFGALIPEETRMLERRRERRRRVLEALGRYATAITQFHQSALAKEATEGMALGAWQLGDELEMLIDDEQDALEAVRIIGRLNRSSGLEAAIERTRGQADRAAPGELRSELKLLRAVLERSHPRQG